AFASERPTSCAPSRVGSSLADDRLRRSGPALSRSCQGLAKASRCAVKGMSRRERFCAASVSSAFAKTPAPFFSPTMAVSLLPRVLKRQPLFALAAIGVVALGIALATTAASLIEALLYRSVPARDAHELHRIDSGLYGGIATAPAARDLMEDLAPL